MSSDSPQLCSFSKMGGRILSFTRKRVSEYDQEIPQSQNADKPYHREEEPHHNHETPGRQTKQSNQLSLPHQDDCKIEWT